MLFLFIAFVVVFFVAPRIVGGVVGALINAGKHGAQKSVHSTVEATRAVKDGYHSAQMPETDALKQRVAGFAAKVQKWAEPAA